MGILELLTIIFVILKSTGVIAWSWWAVFSPLFLAIILALIATIYQGIIYVRTKREIERQLDAFFREELRKLNDKDKNE